MPFVLWLLGMLCGLALAASTVLSRPWSRVRAVVAICIALGIAVVLWAQDHAYAQIELNPAISSPQRLAGSWRLGNSVLVLSPDGDWKCASRWSRRVRMSAARRGNTLLPRHRRTALARGASWR